MVRITKCRNTLRDRRAMVRCSVASLTIPLYVLLALALAGARQDSPPNLTDEACGSTDMRVAVTEGFEIYGHCQATDSGRLLRLTVVDADPQNGRGRLERVSLGFCGEIVDAGAPPGWTV